MKDTYALCLRDHRAFHAIDIAYETPFSQTTPTFINHLLSRHLTAEETLKELEALGLKKEELFLSVALPDGREMLQINPPVFYQIFIPITKAYCTVRLAKIFNERNLSPLLTYNPRINTQRNRVLCELITEFVNTISMWMGYPAVLRQSIQQMLKYGISSRSHARNGIANARKSKMPMGQSKRSRCAKASATPIRTRLAWDSTSGTR